MCTRKTVSPLRNVRSDCGNDESGSGVKDDMRGTVQIASEGKKRA